MIQESRGDHETWWWEQVVGTGGGNKERGAESGQVSNGDKLTRIYCATNDPAERVPCSIIKPVVEAVKTFVGQVFCGSEIEIPN